MKDYPKREVELFRILNNRIDTIETMSAKYQDLTFAKLFGFYGSRGIVLNEKTFIKNLGLKNENGEFNMMAQLLSDDSHIPLRVSIFEGRTKGSNLFSVREFGNNCLLYTLDELLRYGDVLNIIQADERNRVVERKEVPFFDNKAFREAVINAVLHNQWVSGNEPMISVFSDRIEILSRGTIPFTRVGDQQVGNKVANDVGNKKPLNDRRKKIIAEMRDNPNVTTAELHKMFGISETAVENNITFLKANGYVERVGAKKNGYWKVL